MAKERQSFSCNACNFTTVKWLGCCPDCKEWNTFEHVTPTFFKKTSSAHKTITMRPLQEVESQSNNRLFTNIYEWDRVVGGGLMPHSFLVLTGDPGIGKSTLLLQVSYHLAQRHKVFYFSTEESLSQVKQRAERLACFHDNLLFSETTQLEAILQTCEHDKPEVVIIDSIQNCYVQNSSAMPGSVSQLREAVFALMRLAKESKITTLVTSHITKEGIMAGPKTVEHMVDAVFYLQGEDRWQTRMLRAVKNRFGTINELGFFDMQSNGLQEVSNINEHLLKEVSSVAGSCLISILEGSRPLLLELQALTIESKLNLPQRVISGVDHKQVILIAAILEKYLRIKLSAQDIFFKVSGGIKTKGSATDLGIALSLLSSYFQQALPHKSIALGEISLTGQIKPINQIGLFVREAEKFGLTDMLIADHQHIDSTSLRIKRFKHVYELLQLFELS